MLARIRSFLPAPIFRAAARLRLKAALGAYRSSTLSGVPEVLRQRADMERITRLWRQERTAIRRAPDSAAKYSDLEVWLPLSIQRAGLLGLHTCTGKRILDIGCGPGYFLAVARALGHESYGIDAPPDVLSELENRIYGEILEALGCRGDVSSVLVQPYTPLPYPAGSLDLITASLICFNSHGRPGEWGAGEWRFFVQDCWRMLDEVGGLYLEFNPNPERYGALCWYDPETLAFFRSVGSVEGKRVRIFKQAGQQLQFRSVGV